MMTIERGIRSELLKYRRTVIYWFHLCLPALGAGIFLLYLALYSQTETTAKLALILELIALVQPIIIALICGITCLLDENAGHFQAILINPMGRIKSFFSKLSALTLLGAFSTMLLIASILAGSILFSLAPLPSNIFAGAGMILFLGTLPLYVIHIFLSLRWGLGVSVFVGMAESLLVIMFSNVPTFTWPFLPCTWAVKFMQSRLYAIPITIAQIVTTVVIFAFCLLFSFAWFQRWEGKNSFE